MDRNFIRKGEILRLLEQEVVKQKEVNLEHDELMFIIETNWVELNHIPFYFIPIIVANRCMNPEVDHSFSLFFEQFCLY